jgi:hypothetical protein
MYEWPCGSSQQYPLPLWKLYSQRSGKIHPTTFAFGKDPWPWHQMSNGLSVLQHFQQ